MNIKPNLDRRTSTRHACRVEAILRHGSARSHVMILDYHENGLQIWVRDALASGTDVQVCVEHLQVDGRVLWCQQKTAGIALPQPMDAALQAILDRAKAANAPPDVP